MTISTLIKASALLLCLVAPAVAADLDVKKVDAIFDRTPARSDGVYRYGFPRSDLNVTVDGVVIKPAFALGGWVGFKEMNGKAMVMGDLVLTEAEVAPVMAKLLENGVEVTALHNHLLRVTPPIFYMHIGAHGDPEKIATTVRAALELTKTPLTSPPPATTAPSAIEIDTAKIDEALGAKGRVNGGVYQFAIARADKIASGGMVIPSALGSATVINFQPTGGGKAAITGDFTTLASEIEPLITSLRASGIEVTAIHSHMLDEEPRSFYVHFWANDDAVRLAKALRAALDKTNVPRKKA